MQHKSFNFNVETPFYDQGKVKLQLRSRLGWILRASAYIYQQNDHTGIHLKRFHFGV